MALPGVRPRGGFEVPSTALVEMPDGLPPALLVERFDIRRGPQDRRLLALEDFCSILNLLPRRSMTAPSNAWPGVSVRSRPNRL